MTVTSEENQQTRENTENNGDSRKKHLQQELEHLEKAHKSGLISSEEYATAKKTLEKKLTEQERKSKQAAAKEQAVAEILGAASILPSHQKHQKYFIKIEQPKELQKPQKKEVKETKEIKRKAGKTTTKDAIQKEEKLKEEKLKEEILKKVIPLKQMPKEAPRKPLVPEYKNKEIDELIEQEDTNWRFALAILTIFLVILLYVKFTSFGNAPDVIIIDAFVDYESSYSHDIYSTMTSLKEEYGDQLLVEYHLIGKSNQSVLAAEAVSCAGAQNKKQEYVDYLFQQDTLSETTNSFVSLAFALGLETEDFERCLASHGRYSSYEQNIKTAEELDIAYTPTLIINDKKIVGAVDTVAIKAVLDAVMTTLG